jgi:type VII secretion protein EccE
MPDLMAAGRSAGRFGAAQLVSVELAAVVAVAVAYGLPPVTSAICGVVTLVVLVLTLGRSGGRWTYEVVAARRRLARRRREGLRAAGAAAPRRAVLAAFAPDLSTRTATDRGTAFGVGMDEFGWFAAIAVVPPDGLSRDPAGTLGLDWLARLAAETSVPASTLQAVVREADGPPPGVDPASPAAASYRMLRRALGLPAGRQIWLVARLAPRDGALVSAGRGGGEEGVHKALATTLARIGTGLTEAGLSYRILDEAALRAAVTVACGLSVVPGTHPPRERWSRVESDGAVHVSFAVRSWPAEPPAAALSDLARVPDALAVSTAVVFGPRALPPAPDEPAPTAGPVPVRTLIRVAAGPDTVASCVATLRETAARLGVTLVRLNGEQGAGVYATAPTGATIGLAPW